MSMLTAQCGKLRETAANLRAHSTFVGFGGVVNRDPALFDAARQMEDAADTIENLLDRLAEPWTCRMDFIDTFERYDGDEEYLCECSVCGGKSWEPAHDLPQYCRKCGAKVVI